MNWKSSIKFPVIAFLLALLLTGCYEANLVPLEIGAKAPEAQLTLLSGEVVEITNHPGKAQIITFMSSWCPCSNESIPLIKNILERKEIDPEGKIAFLMVGFQSPEKKFRAFAEKWQIPFPVGYDKRDKIARIYGVTAPPTTIFIDAQGVVKKVYFGNIKDNEEEFAEWMKALL